MNAINVISPYRAHGMWVFDDPARGLHQEPFVAGADTWLDRVTGDLPDAANGFTLVFSAHPFPGHAFHLRWRRGEGSGDVYFSPEFEMEGWLCPALLKYFDEAPKDLFVQLKPRV